MTTSITILNNGPDNITIDVIGADGQSRPGSSRTLTPGQFLTNLYVYVGQTLAIAEVNKGAAPAGNFANGPSDGPAPTPDVGSPMEVLFRFYPGKSEAQIQEIINTMSKAQFDLLPLYVKQKMAERTAYFHSADKNFVRPPWYDGVLKPSGGVDFSPTR